jgi:hypothetical protein
MRGLVQNAAVCGEAILLPQPLDMNQRACRMQ